jgi:ABC-2 type transport system permease protein
MGTVFGAFQVLASLVASTFEESQLFSRLAALVPDYVRQALGSSLFTMMSFTGMAVLGYVHVAVTTSLVGLAIAVGTEPASEVERGFSDLVMSRPIRRGAAITRSVLVLIVAASVTNAMILAGTWAGLALFARGAAQWPSPAVLLSLAASLWMLMFCWGGVGLAFGAASRRRAVAGTAAGFLAVTLYLLDVVSRVWKPGRRLGMLSPFHYFNPLELVAGRALNLTHLAILAAIGACGIAVGHVLYARRDL